MSGTAPSVNSFFTRLACDSFLQGCKCDKKRNHIKDRRVVCRCLGDGLWNILHTFVWFGSSSRLRKTPWNRQQNFWVSSDGRLFSVSFPLIITGAYLHKNSATCCFKIWKIDQVFSEQKINMHAEQHWYCSGFGIWFQTEGRKDAFTARGGCYRNHAINGKHCGIAEYYITAEK